MKRYRDLMRRPFGQFHRRMPQRLSGRIFIPSADADVSEQECRQVVGQFVGVSERRKGWH